MFSFEKELLKKLSQKSSGNQNEEVVLMRAFKYFDLNNNGIVEPDEFAKAIEKIGIMIPTRQVSFCGLNCFIPDSLMNRPQIILSKCYAHNFVRIWMPSLVFTILIIVAVSTTRSFQRICLEDLLAVLQPIEENQLLKNYWTDLEPNYHLEELVALLD